MHGAFLGDFRWIVGGIAEQVQVGSFVGAASGHGERYGGQLGAGWMASRNFRLEFLFEGGTRSDGNQWFNYWGIRPAVTWMVPTTSGLGFLASLGFVWRKESTPMAGVLAPAGDGELGASLALGLTYE